MQANAKAAEPQARKSQPHNRTTATSAVEPRTPQLYYQPFTLHRASERNFPEQVSFFRPWKPPDARQRQPTATTYNAYTTLATRLRHHGRHHDRHQRRPPSICHGMTKFVNDSTESTIPSQQQPTTANNSRRVIDPIEIWRCFTRGLVPCNLPNTEGQLQLRELDWAGLDSWASPHQLVLVYGPVQDLVCHWTGRQLVSELGDSPSTTTVDVFVRCGLLGSMLFDEPSLSWCGVGSDGLPVHVRCVGS